MSQNNDCISRRAAIAAIEKLHIPEDMCVFEIVSHIELAIGALPSAQPEIIRCKDCKHQIKDFYEDKRRKDGGYHVYGCELADDYSHVCLDDDFCSRAERRTEDDLISRKAAIADTVHMELFGRDYPVVPVSVLNSLPSAQPERKADLIDRQAAICALINAENHAFNSYYQGLIKAHKIIADLPSVQPERKTGHWLKISPAGIYECSECGKNVMTADIDAYEFCHGCGAKMEVEHE